MAEADARRAVPVQQLSRLLGAAVDVRSVPVPHDCTDGFGAAYWRRPEAYLDPEVRAGVSVLATADAGALREGLQRLEEDLRSGEWYRRHEDLLQAEALDVGYCVVSVDL